MPYRNPVASNDGVPSCFLPSTSHYNVTWFANDRTDDRAIGADDVARLRLVFGKLRFQMIADKIYRFRMAAPFQTATKPLRGG